MDLEAVGRRERGSGGTHLQQPSNGSGVVDVRGGRPAAEAVARRTTRCQRVRAGGDRTERCGVLLPRLLPAGPGRTPVRRAQLAAAGRAPRRRARSRPPPRHRLLRRPRIRWCSAPTWRTAPARSRRHRGQGEGGGRDAAQGQDDFTYPDRQGRRSRTPRRSAEQSKTVWTAADAGARGRVHALHDRPERHEPGGPKRRASAPRNITLAQQTYPTLYPLKG